MPNYQDLVAQARQKAPVLGVLLVMVACILIGTLAVSGNRGQTESQNQANKAVSQSNQSITQTQTSSSNGSSNASQTTGSTDTPVPTPTLNPQEAAAATQKVNEAATV